MGYQDRWNRDITNKQCPSDCYPYVLPLIEGLQQDNQLFSFPAKIVFSILHEPLEIFKFNNPIFAGFGRLWKMSKPGTFSYAFKICGSTSDVSTARRSATHCKTATLRCFLLAKVSGHDTTGRRQKFGGWRRKPRLQPHSTYLDGPLW